MGYLLYAIYALPCLIGGLLVTITDIKSRAVSRLILIISGFLQILEFSILVLMRIFDIRLLGFAFVLFIFSTGIQFAIHHLSHHALAFGDVTATALLSLSFAPLAITHDLFELIALWWLLMGVVGLCVLLCTRLIKRERSIAFVPAIYISMILTILFILQLS